MELIERLFIQMLTLFIAVNTIWLFVCGDGSGFLTTIGFKEKLIDEIQWLMILFK